MVDLERAGALGERPGNVHVSLREDRIRPRSLYPEDTIPDALDAAPVTPLGPMNSPAPL